jgi:hypothetical protein
MGRANLPGRVVPAAPDPSEGAGSGYSCGPRCWPSPRMSSLDWSSATCAAAAQWCCGKHACNLCIHTRHPDSALGRGRHRPQSPYQPGRVTVAWQGWLDWNFFQCSWADRINRTEIGYTLEVYQFKYNVHDHVVGRVYKIKTIFFSALRLNAFEFIWACLLFPSNEDKQHKESKTVMIA